LPQVTIRSRVGQFEVVLSGEINEIPTLVSTMRQLREELATVELSYQPSEAAKVEGDSTMPKISPDKSAAQAVAQLFMSEWSRNPRTLSDISDALEANGIFYPSTTLSEVPVRILRQGKIRRWKSESEFVYVGMPHRETVLK